MQIDEVGVKFGNSKIYSFNPSGLKLKMGDDVVVETAKGAEIGKVAREPRLVDASKFSEVLQPVLRLATGHDLTGADQMRLQVKAYKKDIVDLVKKHKLEMKIVNVDCSFDSSKIIVNFISESRVDFRDLVKELASKYKARIELRQIGSRDEVKQIGGMGPCGRECCCTKGCESDCHVTIKMAKNQGLSLNPSTINGLCGRLMCCLSYENAHYTETAKMMPRIGSEVDTNEGRGMAIYNDMLSREVSVKFIKGDASEIKTFPIAEVKVKKNMLD